MKRFTSLLLFFYAINFFYTQSWERNLSLEKWNFNQEGKSEILPAKVPGTVHTDLYYNKKIEDPFYSDNEQKIQWIENENWIYTTQFEVSKKELNQDHIQLQFLGLDTYAQVFLNGKKILAANNFFRTWEVDAKKHLNVGKNDLKIIFNSAVKKGKEEMAKLPYKLPENERVFVRKPQYQFGWDWGPRLVTAGIWKPILLKFWNNAEIISVKHQQKINKENAEILFNILVNADKTGVYNLTINKNKKEFQLKKGVNSLDFPVAITNPQLWWTHDLGTPNLYHFEIALAKGSTVLNSKNIKIGLRTVELVQEKDNAGKSFYFKLNGKKLYAKGSNTIPLHSFLPTVTGKEYEKLVGEALFANMNMIRVWGGGIYEDDALYDFCDEKGVLVWQDFPFACAMYPGDKDFLENVKKEVVDQVTRLQNHPSLGIWCGNNENDEGWHNWGWQKQLGYTKQDSTKIWKDYVKLFREIIPKTLDSVSAQKPIYWQSSPSNGWGRKQAYTEGDVHYWGVWWGMEPFEKYKEKVGRFVSEYGFQSMPQASTFQAFTQNLSFEDAGVRNHQKHKTGYETIKTYMERDFPVPEKFEDFIYMSQLVQARGMKIAIEAHRTSKPYNMGSLYWQLNDVWPVTSWSSVDYFGNKKAAHFDIKKAFEPTLFTVDFKDNAYKIYLNRDDEWVEAGELTVVLKDFNGKILKNWTKKSERKSELEKMILQINCPELNGFDVNSSYLELLWQSDKEIRQNYFFVAPKFLNLTKANVQIKKINRHSIAVTTDKLVKGLYLENLYGNLSDNYFDLGAGETKIITAPHEIEIKNMKSLNDFIQPKK
ncbi:glycoside hydrolase family 2 protein [Amniculibacterium aquaticum]|uniref:glycoside hydrolase family 2 protein n=1 Tax=Amniculibacterium aquaticum TaxID=2479858 RepID=UPI001F14CB49|nr:sugar-binding domain-containing protein [Amniculibacterium aquaticum]